MVPLRNPFERWNMTTDTADEMMVRDDCTCPLCLGWKDTGLVLCWPCHHDEKRKHGGSYSVQTECLIRARGRQLAAREVRRWSA